MGRWKVLKGNWKSVEILDLGIWNMDVVSRSVVWARRGVRTGGGGRWEDWVWARLWHPRGALGRGGMGASL